MMSSTVSFFLNLSGLELLFDNGGNHFFCNITVEREGVAVYHHIRQGRRRDPS